MSKATVKKIIGENVMRCFKDVLPSYCDLTNLALRSQIGQVFQRILFVQSLIVIACFKTVVQTVPLC